MTAKLEKIENSEAYLEFEIAAEVFDEGLEKAYKNAVKKLDVPGFRKGTAPRAVVEANFGLEVLLEEAMDLVVPDAYYEAIKELNLDTLGEPDIEVGYVVTGQPVTVKVIVPIRPEIILGQIEGLEVSVPAIEQISDAEVENALQNLAAMNKTVIDKMGDPAVMGDTVTIDYKGFVEGTTFEGGEEFKVVIGSDTFIPGFEEQLIGTRQGDDLEVNISFPAGHPAKALAGKNAVFSVSVKKVENIQEKELNDQFAQEVAHLSSLEELHSETRKLMQERAYERFQDRRKQAVVTAALAQCDFSVPENLVMERAASMLEQLSKQLASEGGSIELYLQMTNSNMETLKRDIWKDAKNATRISFMLDKIVEEKGFELGEEEINQGIEAFAIKIGMGTENARERLGPMLQNVLYDLKVGKAIQYMLDHAVITVVEASKELSGKNTLN